MYSDIQPMACFEGFSSIYTNNRNDDMTNYYVGNIVKKFDDNSPNPKLYKIISLRKEAFLRNDKLKSRHRIQVQELNGWRKTTYTKNFPFIHARMEGVKVD